MRAVLQTCRQTSLLCLLFQELSQEQIAFSVVQYLQECVFQASCESLGSFCDSKKVMNNYWAFKLLVYSKLIFLQLKSSQQSYYRKIEHR